MEEGTSILHYTILEKLGEGGMGIVYKATDTRLDRTVALKFLPPHLTRSEQDKERFIREAKAAAALNHPNICTIHADEEFEGQHFISMEYIDGVTLRDKLESEKPDWSLVLEFAIQICGALAEAHEKGIVHRDIKPGNIMVDSKDRIKVMDFGLAKLAGSNPITLTGTTVGTMAYMAPEQIQGRPTDHRADLFSFGVLLFEMLTGRRPFQGQYDAALTYAIVNENPPFLSDLLPNVPQKLTLLVSQLLEKDPAKRYSATEKLAAELKACLDQLTDSAEVSRSNLQPTSIRKKDPVTSSDSGSGSTSITINFPSLNPRNAMLSISATVILLVLIGYWAFHTSDSQATTVNNKIAVLPLQSISTEPENVQFTDGVHEELINRLAGIGDLTVIARSSVLGYTPGERNLRSIANELGVSSLIEGTVRRIGDQLRVSVQLVDINSLGTLWSGSFEEDIDNIFEIQSRIARQVAGELQATLTDEEQQRLEVRPTENPEAYRFYMQGRQYLSRPAFQEENLRVAEQFLERAVEEDPDFAQAWAMLSYAYSSIYWFHGKTPEQLERVKQAVERAKLLGPDLPETHLATGAYLFRSNADYDETLSHFQEALQQFPNEPVLHMFTALSYRRLDNWELLMQHLKRALDLDPLNNNILVEIAYNYWMLRDYEKSINTLDRLMELSEDKTIAYYYRAWFGLSKDGTLDNFNLWWDYLRPSDPAVEEPNNWGDYNSMKRNWTEALRGYRNLNDPVVWQSEVQYKTKDFMIAVTLEEMGDTSAARKLLLQLRDRLENLRDEYPNEPRYKMALAEVYAHLGEADQAIREAKLAEELLQPLTRDSEFRPYIAFHMAIVYAWSGQAELAIDKLEYALSIPSAVHRNDIRLDPTWDPIRDHPRFQELIAETDQPYLQD